MKPTGRPFYDIKNNLKKALEVYKKLMSIMEKAYELANRDQDKLFEVCKKWEDMIDDHMHELEFFKNRLSAEEMEYSREEIRDILKKGYDPEPYYHENIRQISFLIGKPHLCYPTDEEIEDLKEKIETLKRNFKKLVEEITRTWGK